MDAVLSHAASASAADAGLWGSYDRTLAPDRLSPRDITPANVERLAAPGMSDTGEVAASRCGPLAPDGAPVVATDRVLRRHDTGRPIGGGVVCFAGPDGRWRFVVAAGMDHALYGRTGTAKPVVFGVSG